MLTSLKSRLDILDSDTQFDPLLSRAIDAAFARFDLETNRCLARTENAAFEFDPHSTEICPPCYPIESVSRFETKSSERDGWLEQPAIDYLIRNLCIISLQPLALSLQPSALARVIYTGGFLFPDAPAPAPSSGVPQPARLPADLENAAIEQIACWFQNRDHLGLKTLWPHGGTYEQFATLDLLPSVSAILSRHLRWSI